MADTGFPSLECSCGLHATHGLDALRHSRDPAVLGTVAMWGRIVEHTAGYRAELAYPQRLRLICFVCFWRGGAEPSLGLRGGRAAPRGTARAALWLDLDLCGRYGYPVDRLVPASQVEQALLSDYAVDILRTI